MFQPNKEFHYAKCNLHVPGSMSGFCNNFISHLLKMLLYFTHNYTTAQVATAFSRTSSHTHFMADTKIPLRQGANK